MTYRELLNLYDAGKLDDKTRVEVEAELEKHEAIGDYMFSRMDSLSDESYTEHADNFDYAADLTSQIRKTVNRTFLKLGLSIGAAVLVIILAVIFVLPHAVDCFYYDPTEKITVMRDEEKLEQERINLDLSVWTELFMPGKYRRSAYAEPMGYGKYALLFPSTNTANRSSNSIGGILDKNKLTLYDTNAFNRDCAFFCRADAPEEQENIKDASFFDISENLNKEDKYIACFTLTQPIDYETIYRFCVDNKILSNLWFQVYTGDESFGPNIGFAPDTASDSSTNLWWDDAAYPNLIQPYGWKMEEEPEKIHFISLLKYLKDNPEFAEIMGNLPRDYESRIDNMISYVNENGLQIGGFSFTGTKADILALQNEPIIQSVIASPAQ